MKTATPMHGSGKTYYNRIKKAGESWTKLRDQAGYKPTPREAKVNKGTEDNQNQ
jgi:hypothetical protein